LWFGAEIGPEFMAWV